ncbi:MAG: hypothetical protein IT243_06060 [Bacteroidia bacterium]|nr:hypothetical protein [Bacteroidia bacterium]
MSKNKKSLFIIAILLFIVILVFIKSKKQVGGTKQSEDKPKVAGEIINYDTSDASKAGVDISVAPSTIENSTFKIGDEIYAGQNILNAYTSCDFASNGIYHTFNKGDFIGTYLRNSGQCIVVDTPVYIRVNLIFTTISQKIGTKEVYLFRTANIYSKNKSL